MAPGAISGRMGTPFGRCLRLIINNQSLSPLTRERLPASRAARYGYAHVEGTAEHKRGSLSDEIFVRSTYKVFVGAQDDFDSSKVKIIFLACQFHYSMLFVFFNILK